MQAKIQNIEEAHSRFLDLKSKDLNVDLTRGKPDQEQLDLSSGLELVLQNDFNLDGIDTRNYGELMGLDSCRQLGAEIMGCDKKFILAGGNSSLTLMSQYLSSMFFHGSGDGPWSTKERITLLCPVPGYDRHFNLCEEFGINMQPVGLTGQGPDIDEIKELIENDPSVKGIWCVPRHSNPTGEIYSKSTTIALLELVDGLDAEFKIFWDNAYAVHDFEISEPLEDIFDLAKESKAMDSLVGFASTSKITYAGGGVGFMALSEKNMESFIKHYGAVVIGPDKVNQARHVKFFQKNGGVHTHMKRHAAILRPKFDMVEKKLSEQDFGSWTRPTGGYFVSLTTQRGLAKEIINLAKELGLKLTPAGATYPYGVDPADNNIRIAPTACSLEELSQAMDILVCCLALATLKKSS